MSASASSPPAGKERQEAAPVRQVPPPPYAELPMSSSGPLPATGTHHTSRSSHGTNLTAQTVLVSSDGRICKFLIKWRCSEGIDATPKFLKSESTMLQPDMSYY